MSFKWKVGLLSLALALLAGLYVVGILSNSVTQYGQTAHVPLLPSFDPANAEAVELSGTDGKSIDLRVGADGLWSVGSGETKFPASTVKVRTFLDSVAALERGKLVNSDPKLDDRFSLDPQRAKRIAISSAGGKKFGPLLVGKTGASDYEDYLKVEGDKRVFLTKSSMNFYLSQSAAYWYDLLLFPDDATGTSIRSISVSGAIPVDPQGKLVRRETYALTQAGGKAGESKWIASGRSLSLDQARAQAICNHLATLRGVDFSASPRPKSADLTITITTDKGKSYTVAGTAAGGGAQYLFTRDDSPNTYVVNTAALVRSIVPIEALAPQN